jgi:very-short-patch-repair endonuclease
MGYKFRRQHGVEQYVLDFYCPELKLAIEIDGPMHASDESRKRDIQRQEFIEQLGIGFLRLSDDEVRQDVDGVIERIRRWVGDRTTMLNRRFLSSVDN